MLVVIGLVVWAGGLAWFGHLPGDIRIETENVKVYIPLASMLLVSLALSLVLALINRLRKTRPIWPPAPFPLQYRNIAVVTNNQSPIPAPRCPTPPFSRNSAS